MLLTNLDAPQVLQNSHDEPNQALRVIPVAGVMVTSPYDYISVTYPVATQEVYVFKMGGVAGVTVSTVTINYTDASKANLLNVSKT